jgi:serine-type D-Ala-D-Ala carboxypeptidase
MKLRSGTPAEAGMSPQRVRHVAELAQSWVAQGITPALVVLAARRGVIVLHEAFGRLTPEPDSPPLQRDTIYPLASITKPITATAAMILVEEGLLGLNRPVSEYITEFTGEGKGAVMVHHLLTHTSGLTDEGLGAHARKKKGSTQTPPLEEGQNPTIHENLWLLCDAGLSRPPGVEMSYTTYHYDLLGEIVRRVSGRPLDDFARERVFAPLGMNNTFYVVPDDIRCRIVRRPPEEPAAFYDRPELHETPWGGFGAYSTTMDMAMFGQMFLNHGTYGNARILSPASVDEMTRNQIPGVSSRTQDEFFPEAWWGFGWSLDGTKKAIRQGTLRSPLTFHHGGFGGVFLWVDPVYEIVGAYFSVSLQQKTNADLFMNAVTAAVTDA